MSLRSVIPLLSGLIMPTLEDVFNFSHDSEFSQYQQWLSMADREKNDLSIRLSQEEVTHLETWESVQNIYEKVLPEAVSFLSSYEDAFKVQFQKYEQAVKDLENQNKLFEFYKSVLDRLTKLYLDSLSEMLSSVYQEVYSNPDKQVQLTMEDYRNKKVIRIKIINKINGKDYTEDFGAEGGAAQILLGSIVSIYFILTTGAERILFFDESLSSLFPSTSEKFMTILKQFSEQLGFVFVIIDHHKERFEAYAEKVYVVENGVYKSVDKELFFRSAG